MTRSEDPNTAGVAAFFARMFLEAAWRIFTMTQCRELPRNVAAGIHTILQPAAEEASQ